MLLALVGPVTTEITYLSFGWDCWEEGNAEKIYDHKCLPSMEQCFQPTLCINAIWMLLVVQGVEGSTLWGGAMA